VVFAISRRIFERRRLAAIFYRAAFVAAKESPAMIEVTPVVANI